jgi:hypothetical protein
MDCEGGEWDLFTLKDEWRSVKYLTMEYHLWHGYGHTQQELISKINELGFRILTARPVTEKYGMLFAINENLS